MSHHQVASQDMPNQLISRASLNTSIVTATGSPLFSHNPGPAATASPRVIVKMVRPTLGVTRSMGRV